MNEMTAKVAFEEPVGVEEGDVSLSQEQLSLIAGGQCTTNSI